MKPLAPVKTAIHAAGRRYVRYLTEQDARSWSGVALNERTLEYGFCLRALTRHPCKTVLDVGTGTTAWPHLLANCGYDVTAIDNVEDYWEAGMVNRHWPVRNVDICKLNGFSGQFDTVTCISVIEHIQDHVAAVRNMRALLKPGGFLLVTCPYTHHEFCPNTYAMPDAVIGKDEIYICRSYSAEEINEWLAAGFKLAERELWNLYSGPRWASGKKGPWVAAADENAKHDLGCFAFQAV